MRLDKINITKHERTIRNLVINSLLISLTFYVNNQVCKLKEVWGIGVKQ